MVLFRLRCVVPFSGHGGKPACVPVTGRFHGLAGRFAVFWDGLVGRCRCSRWSGGRVREGDDGRGDAGDRVLQPGVRERARGLGLAGAVPVPVADGPEFRDLAGQRLVAGLSGADRGEDEAAGAGEGQVAGADGLPGAASLCGRAARRGRRRG